MRVGIMLGDEPVTTSPKDHVDLLLRQVHAAQEAGIELIVIGQHFLYPGLRWLQPVPTIARIAAETDDHVRLGTSVISVPLYSPVVLAEELATLDILTGGRLTVGLGAGYRKEEFAAMGVPYEERYPRFEEAIELMRQLWAQDEVEFHGRFFDVEGSRHLDPVQQPHPPIWIGAQGPKGVGRVARLGAEWIITPQLEPDRIRELMHIYESELPEGAAAPTPFPIRREVMIGASREDALDHFVAMAREKYLAYAQRGMKAFGEDELNSEFENIVSGHAVLGTPDDVVRQLTQLASSLPVDPIIVRPHWPGMSADRVESFLADLGRDVIPALRDVTPAQAVPA